MPNNQRFVGLLRANHETLVERNPLHHLAASGGFFVFCLPLSRVWVLDLELSKALRHNQPAPI